MPPFLSIITPYYKRPQQFAACIASVGEQTAIDRIEHVASIDHEGIGIGRMYSEVLPKFRDMVSGQYVYILCDDDELTDFDVVAQVERYAKYYQYPPVIIVNVNKGGLQWPDSDQCWPPREGHIDLGCFIVRADVWKAHVADYGERYAGDADFAAAIHRAGHEAAYLPLLFARGAVSRGAAEAA
jgi:hypothetical protein